MSSTRSSRTTSVTYVPLPESSFQRNAHCSPSTHAGAGSGPVMVPEPPVTVSAVGGIAVVFACSDCSRAARCMQACQSPRPAVPFCMVTMTRPFRSMRSRRMLLLTSSHLRTRSYARSCLSVLVMLPHPVARVASSSTVGTERGAGRGMLSSLTGHDAEDGAARTVGVWCVAVKPRRRIGDVIVQQFLNEDSGCLSYLIGCGDAGEAIVVDPGRDRVNEYLRFASKKGMKITRVVETHTHADHISGGRDLRAASGATILVHPAAGLLFEHSDVRDGDELAVGDVR